VHGHGREDPVGEGRIGGRINLEADAFGERGDLWEVVTARLQGSVVVQVVATEEQVIARENCALNCAPVMSCG
jgi:hypothetical protein